MHNTPLRLFPDESETIEGAGRALRAGRTSCAAVLERCFHQIDLWDAKVNAWVFVDRAGAMRQARALDEELKTGRCRGPLHGIPFGIKDIIDVAGMPTACGFPPWRDRVAVKDAALVGRLRDAGAVILGKTVTTQFAWIDPPPTRNPWNPGRTPGGSSSGSAAAVATGMCLAALGTQTGGSILRPASFCGVAGMKPGYDFLDDSGVFPFAPSLDHPGAIARTARDLALAFSELAGAGYQWPAHGDPEEHSPAGIDARAVRLVREAEPPPRLGRLRGFYDRRAEPAAREALDRTLAAIADAGAVVDDVPDDAFDFEGLVAKHRILMAAEAAALHEARFAEHRDDYAPRIRALIEEGLATPVGRYVRAQLEWRTSFPALSAWWDRFEAEADGRANVLVMPSTIGPAPDASTTGEPAFNSPWSYLGVPALTIPIGLSPDGLPLGMQIVGDLAPAHGTDGQARLLEAAVWCEDVLRRASAKGGRDG